MPMVSRLIPAIGHFMVVDLVPWPSSECEADGDLVLVQSRNFHCFVKKIVLEKY